MASIIDSFKDTFSDKFAFIKIAVLSIPVYFTYEAYINADYANFFWLVSITFLLLFGFLAKVTNNIINDKESVLPSLNPLPLLFSALKGLLAILLPGLICYFIASYICSIINIIPWLDITLKTIIWIIVTAVILTSFLMYAKREKIRDAYNVKAVFNEAGDLMVVILLFILQLILINLPTVVFIGYTILVLFGFGPFFDAFVSLAIVFNIGITGHYLGQTQFEVIEYKRKNRDD
jgi:hypothetical protein